MLCDRSQSRVDLDVSQNRGGPPKWMVKIMENPIKLDDLGVPLFLETPISRKKRKPKHPDPSRKFVGLMVEQSHHQVIGLVRGNPGFLT